MFIVVIHILVKIQNIQEKNEYNKGEQILDLIFETCENHTFSIFSDILNFTQIYLRLRETILTHDDIREIDTQNTSNIFHNLLNYPPKITTPNGISILLYDQRFLIEGRCITNTGSQLLFGFLEKYTNDTVILPYLLEEMSGRQQRLLGQINHIKDNIKCSRAMQNASKVQLLQAQISGLLLITNTIQNNNTYITLPNNYATHTDFLGMFLSIDAYHSFIYAQKPEYLANIILGFDPISGALLTSKEKTSHFGKYFNPHRFDNNDEAEEDDNQGKSGFYNEDEEEIECKSEKKSQIPFPIIEDDMGYTDGEQRESYESDTINSHSTQELNELPSLESYNEPPLSVTEQYIEIPESYSPIIRDDNYLSTQRIQTVDISKLEPSSLLYTLVAPLANNIKTILTDVETIEQSERYYYHVQNAGLHEHAKFKQLYDKRKNKYADTNTINEQETWNKYHKEVMQPFESELRKIKLQKYILCINNTLLPHEINEKIKNYLFLVEDLVIQKQHNTSLKERIQQGWGLMGPEGNWFFDALQNATTQYEKAVLFLGQDTLGKSFTGLPDLGIRTMLDIGFATMDTIKNNPGLNYEDVFTEQYCNALKKHFDWHKDKYVSHTKQDIDALIETCSFLKRIKDKKVKELYQSSPSLLAQLALHRIELLLKKQFKLQDNAQLGSILQKTFFERVTMRADTYFSGMTEPQEYMGKQYDALAISRRFMIEQYNAYLEKYNTRIDINIFLKIIQDKLPLNIVMNMIEILSTTPEQLDKQGLSRIIDKEVNEVYSSSSFTVGTINYITSLTEFAHKYHIPLLRPLYQPLEQYAIHRIRRPESGNEHYNNELFFDRYSGTSGYEKRDLGNTTQLLSLLQDVGSPITLTDILSLEYRSFANISPERWIDIYETVPVQVGLPFVEVIINAFRDKNQEAHARYILSMNPDSKKYTLRIDGTVKDAGFLQHKHHIYDEIILGGGRAHLFHHKGVIELSHRIDEHGAEPRILTATACVNTLNKALPISNTSRKVFLGDDGYVKLEDYF